MDVSTTNGLTNFREVRMGGIRGGLLYRGDYPVFKMEKERDDEYERLVSDAKIACVINLADDGAGLERIAKLAPWYRELLRGDNVIGLDIQFEFDFLDKFAYEVFNYRLRCGFEFLMPRNGPYLVHCNAGIDRTGFFAAIMGLLFGATMDEVIYDYLLSHGKAFADAKDEELNFITGRNIYGQMNAITKGKVEDGRSLQANIEKYFLEDIGLTIGQLGALKEKFSCTVKGEKK